MDIAREVDCTAAMAATEGERYAAALAAIAPTSNTSGGVSTISRVGIRIYLSVGAGGEPITAFTIGTITAARNAAGHPVATAEVHNTGQRAVDVSASPQLANGPGSLAAGPFVANNTATLAPGASGPRDRAQRPSARRAVAGGHHLEVWHHHSNRHATITFPSAAGQGEPVAATLTTDTGRSLAVPAGAAATELVLVGATFGLVCRRRRMARA